MEMKRNM